MSERKAAPNAPRIGIGARGRRAPHRLRQPSHRRYAAAQKPATPVEARQAEALRGSSFKRAVSFSHKPREFTKTIVDLWASHLVQNGRLDMGPDGGAAQAAVRMQRGRRALGHDGPQRPIRFPCILDGCPARTSAPLSRAVPGTGKSRRRGRPSCRARARTERSKDSGGASVDTTVTGPRRQEPGHFLARAHRGRQPDALGRSLQQIV